MNNYWTNNSTTASAGLTLESLIETAEKIKALAPPNLKYFIHPADVAKLSEADARMVRNSPFTEVTKMIPEGRPACVDLGKFERAMRDVSAFAVPKTLPDAVRDFTMRIRHDIGVSMFVARPVLYSCECGPRWTDAQCRRMRLRAIVHRRRSYSMQFLVLVRRGIAGKLDLRGAEAMYRLAKRFACNWAEQISPTRSPSGQGAAGGGR